MFRIQDFRLNLSAYYAALVFSLKAFLWKPYPISDQNLSNLYPFSDQSSSKTISFGASIGEYPLPRVGKRTDKDSTCTLYPSAVTMNCKSRLHSLHACFVLLRRFTGKMWFNFIFGSLFISPVSHDHVFTRATEENYRLLFYFHVFSLRLFQLLNAERQRRENFNLLSLHPLVRARFRLV